MASIARWNGTARAALLVVIQGALLAVIAAAFWWQDWQYALPTPRPDGFYQAPLGSRPQLPAALQAQRKPGRPILVHFANPHCPCTEFNLDHLRNLHQAFAGQVDFLVALQTHAEPAQAQREFEDMHLSMPMVVDRDGSIGEALGVYGTPQAALLDADGRLYYRGNYNQSRYCLDGSSEFARIALQALTGGHRLPAMPPAAFITVGCPILRLPRAPEAIPGS